MKIRPEDEEYVKQRTAEMAEKVAMAAKQTSGEAGGEYWKVVSKETVQQKCN